ncbi:hypothetical protein ACHAW6_015843 [Cyclotella cf. meneghiniana]
MATEEDEVSPSIHCPWPFKVPHNFFNKPITSTSTILNKYISFPLMIFLLSHTILGLMGTILTNQTKELPTYQSCHPLPNKLPLQMAQLAMPCINLHYLFLASNANTFADFSQSLMSIGKVSEDNTVLPSQKMASQSTTRGMFSLLA